MQSSSDEDEMNALLRTEADAMEEELGALYIVELKTGLQQVVRG